MGLIVFWLLSFRTDIWTRKGMTESFLGITAHYMLADWQRRVATLAVRTFPSPHTADRVRILLENVLDEWKIELGQVYVVYQVKSIAQFD